MIPRRVANVIKGLSRDRDQMRLANLECVRGFDAERKFLHRPTENSLPNLAPLQANGNLGAYSSHAVATRILKRNVNVAVCFHFCVNNASCESEPFLFNSVASAAKY